MSVVEDRVMTPGARLAVIELPVHEGWGLQDFRGYPMGFVMEFWSAATCSKHEEDVLRRLCSRL